jgi:hypothetical protein
MSCYREDPVKSIETIGPPYKYNYYRALKTLIVAYRFDYID